METTEIRKRIQTTVMIEPELRRELRRLAAANDVRVSDLINEAVRRMLGMKRGA
jgi:mRNA-degrading endonuclease RelE of RelBE toxin-antitoxin system